MKTKINILKLGSIFISAVGLSACSGGGKGKGGEAVVTTQYQTQFESSKWCKRENLGGDVGGVVYMLTPQSGGQLTEEKFQISDAGLGQKMETVVYSYSIGDQTLTINPGGIQMKIESIKEVDSVLTLFLNLEGDEIEFYSCDQNASPLSASGKKGSPSAPPSPDAPSDSSLNGVWFTSCLVKDKASTYTKVEIGRTPEIVVHNFDNPVCLDAFGDKDKLIGGAFVSSRLNSEENQIEFFEWRSVPNQDWRPGSEAEMTFTKETGIRYDLIQTNGRLNLSPLVEFERLAGKTIYERAFSSKFKPLEMGKVSPEAVRENMADISSDSALRNLFAKAHCMGNSVEALVSQINVPISSGTCFGCIKSQRIIILGKGSNSLNIAVISDLNIPPDGNNPEDAKARSSTLNVAWSYIEENLWLGDYGHVSESNGQLSFNWLDWGRATPLKKARVMKSDVSSLVECE